MTDRSPGRREAPECLRASLSRPRLLETITIGELSMTPIVADRPRGKPAYSLFAHAARDGTAWINEVSDSGVVAKLLAVNDGDQPVLLVDGDQLVGAKQNRMINLTVLVAAKSQLELPVTCIEAGRWSYRSRRFDPGDDFVHSELRRAKMDQVNRAMRSGSRHADQGAVWNEVGGKFAIMLAATGRRVASDTQSLSDGQRHWRDLVGDAERIFTAVPNQVGAVFSLGRSWGVEIYDHPDTLAEFLPKIVRSWAYDAVERRARTARPGGQAREVDPQQALDLILGANFREHKALGEGVDLRIDGPDVTAGALVWKDTLVNLVAYGGARSRQA